MSADAAALAKREEGETSAGATKPVTVRRRYPDAPLVGVAAAVFNDAGEVLLVRRGQPPRAGQWGLPGGLLDLGETLAAGARRELWEECAVEIKIGDIVAAYEPIQRDAQGAVEYHYVVVDFWASHIAGEPRAQDDAAAVAWVALPALDPYQLSSETHQVIVKAYHAWQASLATSPHVAERR
jgi:ADP-ribose pyrophosphatase YjhB (NUDIX family)